MPQSSLADWLRTASDSELAELLHVRRDLAVPPPADSTVLAARACAPGSLARACAELDRATLAVLETLLVADADREPVALTTLTELLGMDLAPVLAQLRVRAIVWGPDDAIRVVPTARDIFGTYPAGLGRVHHTVHDTGEFSAPANIEAIVASVGDDERALLNALAVGPPIGRTKAITNNISLDTAKTPVEKLLARGLLVRIDQVTVELPRQVGMALRGGHVFPRNALVEPELASRTHTVSTVDTAAAGEAMEILRQLDSLIQVLSHQPAPALKSGGLGVREIRKLSRQLGTDDARVTLLIELAADAGLIAARSTGPAEWLPTTLADSWQVSSTAVRWLNLARTWLDLPRQPGLAGSQDPSGKPLAALAEELRRPMAPATRQRVLAALAELPPGAGAHDVENLVDVLAWRAPRRDGPLRDDLVRWCFQEASALGLLAMGALTTATRQLLDEDRDAALSAMVHALPAPIDHVLIQPDLTIVAPGPLTPELAADIADVADVESAGHATVYRVTEATVKRALDCGRTAAELHALFVGKSATPVPQSLTYLVDDVARRHGRVRGGHAGCFLRCDDEKLLAEVCAHPIASELMLRRIAATVVISPLPLAEVIDELRSAGFTPIAEGPDGSVLDLRAKGQRLPGVPVRAHTRRPAAAAKPAAIGVEQMAAVLAHIRAGDKAASKRRGVGTRLSPGGGPDTAATVALLAQASRDQREVWIDFVDSHGTALQRIVTPIRVGGGVLEGADHERYPLHRITSVALVDD